MRYYGCDSGWGDKLVGKQVQKSHMRTYCILAADSRARGFDEADLSTYHQGYKAIRRGAKIQDLHQPVIHQLSKIPKDIRVFIKIAAAINNLTKKIHPTPSKQHIFNRRYHEIVPSSQSVSNVLDQLHLLKSKIKKYRPSAIISHITIPPANFQRYPQYQSNKYHTKSTIFTSEQLLPLQDNPSSTNSANQ
jgi:hypothetical protein